MPSTFQNYLAKRKLGVPAGICSVCSAHPWVIRAAAEQAAAAGSLLLVEATSNQVNQFGGYTGMRPAGFRSFVLEHVEAAGVAAEMLILGGDHLGPNPWRALAAAEAMALAETMVAEYVREGFTKIHLDASMPCGDDPVQLSDEVVAQRTVQLCKAAEHARVSGDGPVYGDWHRGPGAGGRHALG
jgi:D-tagatose-1,6-bisphosphate aldolase subunit GatZ/KbaZ